MDICHTMLIAERVVDPVVDAPGQGRWLLSRVIPLAQCSPNLSEGIIGLRKRRRLKVTWIQKRSARKKVRPMICKSFDDDPRFKVNGTFNGGNVQVYHPICILINLRSEEHTSELQSPDH